MDTVERFTSVVFQNFKAFRRYSIALNEFNILVGPNNSGKSTILAAFRILAEGMRRARTRTPVPVSGPNGDAFGYRVDLSGLPVAAENIFSDYDASKPALIRFRISNGNKLLLHFPERNICHLITESTGRPVQSPAAFKACYNCPVAFVPVLGPVEHNEPLNQKEAARRALLSHRASRNFRNIWHHYPERFAEFQSLVESTWPGMSIESPKIDISEKESRLHMFCLEERIPRELFWVGFGFQVWCQMLTYVLEADKTSLLVIDEPDIYLHSDLQRRLLSILKNINADVLIATHSTEIVSEADPQDILVVTKRTHSARRLRNTEELQGLFITLGSNLNPVLTQMAKSRCALFVEGKDFQVLTWFAEVLGYGDVAHRVNLTIIPAEGFRPQKINDVSAGIEVTLGFTIRRGAIFDRDYRSDAEVETISSELQNYCNFVHIHDRKEIENFLLSPTALRRAIKSRLSERRRRTGGVATEDLDVAQLLREITDGIRLDVESQFLSSRLRHERSARRSVDEATLNKEALHEFETRWSDFDSRLRIVPGKTVLARLNTLLNERHHISLSHGLIVRSFRREDVPTEMVAIIQDLQAFCCQ